VSPPPIQTPWVRLVVKTGMAMLLGLAVLLFMGFGALLLLGSGFEIPQPEQPHDPRGRGLLRLLQGLASIVGQQALGLLLLIVPPVVGWAVRRRHCRAMCGPGS
jgi:hypothetical protein